MLPSNTETSIVCDNCNEPQENAEGILDIIDGLCDNCREQEERVSSFMEDSKRYLDFDYSMN